MWLNGKRLTGRGAGMGNQIDYNLHAREMSYRERLVKLKLLRCGYDREVKRFLLVFESLYGNTTFNMENYVSAVRHRRTRLSLSLHQIFALYSIKTFWKIGQSSFFQLTNINPRSSF